MIHRSHFTEFLKKFDDLFERPITTKYFHNQEILIPRQQKLELFWNKN